MRKEAVMISAAIAAILALVGVVVTPEQKEAIEAVIVVVLPLALGLVARSQVASKDTLRKKEGAEVEAQVFRK